LGSKDADQPSEQDQSSHQELKRQSNQNSSIKSAHDASLMAREALSQELEVARNELAAACEAHAASEAEVRRLRDALSVEKDRAFRAEVQVSELQVQLRHMGELEQELHKYKDLASLPGPRTSGLWGYFAGAT
jgi:hypothetical protein